MNLHYTVSFYKEFCGTQGLQIIVNATSGCLIYCVNYPLYNLLFQLFQHGPKVKHVLVKKSSGMAKLNSLRIRVMLEIGTEFIQCSICLITMQQLFGMLMTFQIVMKS